MSSKGAARNRGQQLAWMVPAALVVLVVIVLVARWLREVPAVAGFITDYPGTTELPEAAPVGLPAWVGWQHFLNAFLLVFIVRSGWLIRTTQRPKGHWQPRGAARGKKPVRISLNLWLHLAADLLWVLNGLVFVVLIVVTGHWMRLVPTSWDVFPHALSVGVQYLSLDWPAHGSWVNYNALQVLSYFVTVFIAAPLALITGLRMSPAWPASWRFVPMSLARALHFPLMVYFVAFTVVHVALVLATDAQGNLNHMFAARNDGSWLGLVYFAIALALMVAAWVVAKPVFTQPVAALTGKVTR
ncbi:cytochrome b/b6 domain-containing protein [Georgenia satyanarayanai]|uniref:cytochrome b/b6 domain-containing protein n=1 Tax=Georgenia satyanarayanai TaxID=860221 RepID=UPI00203ACD04|nr:cytochrome b/b6 domain-containing protein [Georgenia satyanarayanai]MCM3659490.1 cytochrome b/b6 domain-containing protein [Georgenia satyanarayanai]